MICNVFDLIDHNYSYCTFALNMNISYTVKYDAFHGVLSRMASQINPSYQCRSYQFIAIVFSAV